ncbi:MAG: phage tail family protein [Clostridia bacterium]|nr:phage tail family protein [Clostridia bacterium]
MKLIYENERGKIVMNGGGSKGFNITQIRGISLPECDVEAVRYPYMAGQVVTRVTPMERTITISADVRDDNKKELSRAMNVFSAPGTISITSCGKTKKINVRCVNFEPNKSKGAYIPFTVQFCADCPYFEDIYDTAVYIAKREGKLASAFVLGCVFSVRVLKNLVINYGDVSVEPVFEISSVDGAVCPQGICIKNNKNGNEILLNTDVLAGETITVDIKNRKIKSNKRGNLISCLAQDTAISRFSIDVGVSEIEILTPEISGKLSVKCRYNNSYMSAVV